MTAPLVMTLDVPGVHWDSSEAGSVKRQENVPSWGWASSSGAVTGPAGVKLTGR